NVSAFGGAGIQVFADGGSTATIADNTIYDVSTLAGAFWIDGDVDAYNNVLHSNSGTSVATCANGAWLYNNFMVENTPYRVLYASGNCTAQHNTMVRNE